MEAAWMGHASTVELLIKHGADSTIEAANGGSALAFAAANNQLSTTKALLLAGSSPNSVDSNRGVTPLSQVVMRGHIEIAKLLLENGADPLHASEENYNALEIASQVGKKEMLELLFPKVPLSEKDLWQAVLGTAAQGNQEELVVDALDRGASPIKYNRFGESAVHQAASSGSSRIIELLLSNGGNPNQLSEKGWSPLLLAQKAKNRDAALALLKAGADVNQPEPQALVTPIFHAAIAGDEELVKEMLDRGADASFVGQDNMTPRQWAEEYQHSKTAKLLELAEK